MLLVTATGKVGISVRSVRVQDRDVFGAKIRSLGIRILLVQNANFSLYFLDLSVDQGFGILTILSSLWSVVVDRSHGDGAWAGIREG